MDTSDEKVGRPTALGEKLALWGIAAMLFYLIFIDK